MARPKSDIDKRIVHAARSRFLHDGVDGASLRSIADDARTNVGMIYYYFPTKDDLFLAVVEDIYVGLLAELEAALSPEGDTTADERIGRLFARLARISDDELTVMRLVVREVLVSSTRRARIVERFLRGHFPMLIAAIMSGVQTGELRSDVRPEVMLIAVSLLAIMPQIAVRLASTAAPHVFASVSPDTLASGLWAALRDGIATRPADSHPDKAPPPRPRRRARPR